MYQVSHMHYSSLMTNSNVEKLLHSKPITLQIPTPAPPVQSVVPTRTTQLHRNSLGW